MKWRNADANKVFSKLLVLCMFSIGARYLEDEHVPHIGKNSGCKHLADAQRILSEFGPRVLLPEINRC